MRLHLSAALVGVAPAMGRAARARGRLASHGAGDGAGLWPVAMPRPFESAPRHPGRWALAISAAIHVAVVLAAAGTLTPWQRTLQPAPAPAFTVVHVHLAAPAPAVAARPATVEPDRVAAPAAKSVARRSEPREAPATARLAPHLLVPMGPLAPAPAPLRSLDQAVAVLAAPDSAAAMAAPLRATADDFAPAAYRHAPDPDYPQVAREDGKEGLVVLRVRVSPEGLPVELRIARSSGHRALDRAALAGVGRWTFVPARREGRDVEGWLDVPIRFELR